jgi:hypothetical protein
MAERWGGPSADRLVRGHQRSPQVCEHTTSRGEHSCRQGCRRKLAIPPGAEVAKRQKFWQDQGENMELEPLGSHEADDLPQGCVATTFGRSNAVMAPVPRRPEGARFWKAQERHRLARPRGRRREAGCGEAASGGRLISRRSW